jgi:hypothetical protein
VALCGIVVRADLRGRGLGRRLVIEVADVLRAEGAARLVARLEGDHGPVAALLARAGLRRLPMLMGSRPGRISACVTLRSEPAAHLEAVQAGGRTILQQLGALPPGHRDRGGEDGLGLGGLWRRGGEAASRLRIWRLGVRIPRDAPNLQVKGYEARKPRVLARQEVV